MCALEQDTDRQVLGLDIHDHTMHIYRCEQRTMRELSDPFEAFDSGGRGDVSAN